MAKQLAIIYSYSLFSLQKSCVSDLARNENYFSPCSIHRSPSWPIFCLNEILNGQPALVELSKTSFSDNDPFITHRLEVHEDFNCSNLENACAGVVVAANKTGINLNHFKWSVEREHVILTLLLNDSSKLYVCIKYHWPDFKSYWSLTSLENVQCRSYAHGVLKHLYLIWPSYVVPSGSRKTSKCFLALALKLLSTWELLFSSTCIDYIVTSEKLYIQTGLHNQWSFWSYLMFCLKNKTTIYAIFNFAWGISCHA